MVGIRKFKFILGIFIPFSFIYLMSQNTFAISTGFDFFSFYYNTPSNQSYVYSGHKGYDSATFNIHAINRVAASSTSVGSVPANANYMSVTAKFNLLTWTDNGNINYLPSSGSEVAHIRDVAINDSPVNFESSNLNIYSTTFVCDPLNSGITTNCRTLTYEFTFVVKNVSGTINSVSFAALYDGNLPLYTGFRDGFNCYFEYDSNNKVIVDFSYDYTSALLQQQTQLQSITNNNLIEINNSITDYTDQQNEAYDNISGQSSSDIQNADNQQTTSLIGFISDFLVVLTGLNTNPSGANCNISLPFPDFVGGTQSVNVCTGKDGLVTNSSGLNFITIFGRLMMMCFFIPFCFILLKMIYNEIRSWTSG